MSMALKEKIIKKCAELDIPLVGFAPAVRWDEPPLKNWVPEQFRPRSIFFKTQTVIVIGLPVSLPVVETAPSIFYHELYRTVNTLLDTNGYRISLLLNAEGFPSVWIPRDGYASISILKDKPVAFFSHRHAACFAGFKKFWHKQYGADRKIWTESTVHFDFYRSRYTSGSCDRKTPVYTVHAMRERMPGTSRGWQGIPGRVDRQKNLFHTV
jgi:hypothetical protein